MNALPTSLVRFETQLEDAIRARGRRRPGHVLRLASVAALAAAAALGVLSALPGDDPSAVARAADVLDPAGNTILHTVLVTTQVYRDGARTTHRSESWQQNVAPYDAREVSDGREVAIANGRPQVYSPRTDTISTLAPGTKIPPARADDVGERRLVQHMRRLLETGEAREAGRLVVAGRAAIRIVSSTSEIVVDAETFAPIEWRTVSDDGVRLISRFETYELLAATPEALALLDLRAQHPDAAVEPGITVEGW